MIGHNRQRGVALDTGLDVRLPYRPPFDWCHCLEFLRAHLTPGVEAIDGEAREFFGIDLGSAARERGYFVAELRPVARHLLGFGIEQKGANGGASHVETYNEGIGRARAGAQNHFSL